MRACLKPTLHGMAVWVAVAFVATYAPCAEPIHVRASQIGYLPRDSKLAVAFAAQIVPQEFQVLDAETGRPVWEGQSRPIPGGSWAKFQAHAELDFSALDQPGRYFLRMGTAQSHPFRIGDDVFRDLPDVLLEFMRQQRCNDNPWLNASCHTLDGRTAFGPTPPGTPLDARGGWHDAADLLKYLITSSNATAQMLLAWQLEQDARAKDILGSPSVFADRMNDRGRPGANGLPDLLDEAHWGLTWMLKLHPAPDQLYHQVADDRDHAGWRLPQHENVDYGWGKGRERVVYFADGKPQGLGRFQSQSNGVANIAGRYAAAMALAYQVFRDRDAYRNFAQQCLQAGIEVYQFGRRRRACSRATPTAPRIAMKNPPGPTTWSGARPSCIVRRATAHTWTTPSATRGSPPPNPGWEKSRPGTTSITRSSTSATIASTISWIPNSSRSWRRITARELRARGTWARRIPTAWRCLSWCSNNLVTALATQGLLYERMTGDREYAAMTARQRDWLLGRNPWGTTMFTGIGHVSPRSVHLMTTRLTGRPIRGGLVDGPVRQSIFQGLKGVSITEPDPLAPFQDERAVYHDDVMDYSTNEPTMDGTASAILLLAIASRH